MTPCIPARRIIAGCAALVLLGLSAGAEPALIARWSFDEGGASTVAGAPAASITGATSAPGKEGKALAFEDWSTRNYVKPDPRQATRAVVAHDPRLNPAGPFRLSAWIHPTADPVYYGGIVEKGRGYGASYRLVLLRGLKVEASFGERHVTVRSAAPLTLNEWHQVALVVEPGALILTVDGKEAGRTALSGPQKAASTEPLLIGERFTGRIDEVVLETP